MIADEPTPEKRAGDIMRPIFGLLLLLTLSGCDAIRAVQLYPKVSTANDQMAKAKVDCDAKFPARPGNYVPHARCINAMQDWVVRPLMPYPDLLTRSQTARLMLSAKADRGELDPGALSRLTTAEDNQLTLASTTLNGPLTRYIAPDYYAPVPQEQAPGCTSEYGFSDCHQ